MFPLTADFHQIATENVVDMLKLAHHCYMTASRCEGEDYTEEWLHHYMLGKMAEKMNTHPKEYLYHYKQVARCKQYTQGLNIQYCKTN